MKITKTIEFTITLNENGLCMVDSYEQESGCKTGLFEVDNPQESKDYIIEMVGKEVYSWIQLMQDEMEEVD